MPESNAAKVRRMQKNNRLNGIGDENGRLTRQKDPPKMMKCATCQMELKITKTNTELTAHATSRHNSTLELCFPGAAEIAQELINATTKSTTCSPATTGGSGVPKKKQDVGLDDLLSAGLNAGKKGKK